MEKSFFQRAATIAVYVWIIGLTISGITITIRHISEGVSIPLSSDIHFDTIHAFLDALKSVSLSGSHVTNILCILGLNLIAMLTGSRILRWLRIEPDSLTMRVAFAIPIGLGIFSVGVFWIGICGLLYKGVIYTFLALLTILSLFEIKPLVKDWREGARCNIDKIDYIFLPLICLFIVMPLFSSFSPVVVIDGLLYHLALPKIYLANHGITYVPDNLYSMWPANAEMLFLLGLLISGASLSKLFSFSISIIFLLVMFSLGRRFFSKTAGYLCVVVFLLFPEFIVYMSTPMVDISFALYAVSGIFAFVVWMDERRNGWLYMAAVCCGFAAATKLQGLFFVLVFLTAYLLTAKREAIQGRILLYCILAIAGVAVPWYARSWMLTGNPLFPFLYNLFGGKNWNDYSNLCLIDHCNWSFFKGVRDFKGFIKLTRWLFFSASGPSNPPVLLIFLAPGLIGFRGWSRVARYLFFIAIAYYVFSLLTSPQVRLLFPFFSILSIIVGYVITTMWAKNTLLRVIIALSVASCMSIGFLKNYRVNEEPFFAGLGVINPQEYRETHDIRVIYDLCQWTNENVPENSRILLWSIKGGYLLDTDYVLIDPIVQGVLDFGRINNAQAFLSAIKELGITHVLYFPDGLTGTPSNLPHKHFLRLWHEELAGGGELKLIKEIGDSGVYRVW